MKVLIIDYKMGNVGSVKRALEECGATEVVISHDLRDFEDCTHAVLPGVGAFPDAMKHLKDHGLINPIKKLATEDGVPFLGICLGMQLLASVGEEIAACDGLDLIPGNIEILKSQNNERIPHVGWNEINIKKSDHLFEGISNQSDFYFVHSYHFKPTSTENIICTTPYCGEFISVVRNGNIIGTQFHPEKSAATGFKLLKNFLNL